MKILFANRWQIASPMESNGLSQVELFMEEVGSGFESNLNGLLIMMERHSKQGPETFNTAQCHYVDQDEKIYEYIKGRLRLFWFEDDDKIVVCTHGIVKKSQKTPRREIQRAIRVKRTYSESKSLNSLRFLSED
nr:type II toxin-antitoxin system RelE/ParE family toxin [Pseudomonas gingeri]